jgi:hypothetical protein
MVLFVGRHGIPPWPLSKQSNGDVAEKAYRANRCYQGEWKTPIPQVTSSTEGRSEVQLSVYRIVLARDVFDRCQDRAVPTFVNLVLRQREGPPDCFREDHAAFADRADRPDNRYPSGHDAQSEANSPASWGMVEAG